MISRYPPETFIGQQQRKIMRIGELAASSGVAVETIRFYESKGLLPEPVRTPNNYRVYGQEHLARLHFIRHCRALGIGLDEVAKLCEFESRATGVGNEGLENIDFSDVHALIDGHLKAVKERIAELTVLQKNLEVLQKACTGNHEACACGILEKLEAYDKNGCECCRHFDCKQHDH